MIAGLGGRASLAVPRPTKVRRAQQRPSADAGAGTARSGRQHGRSE